MPITTERLQEVQILLKARRMWSEFDVNEKTGVRVGMFPAAKMRQAEEEGYDSSLLVPALMECADRDGGDGGMLA